MPMDELLVTPEKSVRYACKRGGWTLKEVTLPPTIVMAMPAFMHIFEDRFNIEEVEKSIIRNHYRKKEVNVSFVTSRIGGPSVALDLEEMIFLGGSTFIHLGFAGGLHNDMNNDMNLGDIVITKGVLNETGIPRLYGIDDSFIPSDYELTEKLIDAARKKGVPVKTGVHWCTDAPYRETKGKVTKYVKEGALCVEMEGSALFAVSMFHNVRAAAVYVITDIIKQDGWHQAWHAEEIEEGCKTVVDFVSSFIGIP